MSRMIKLWADNLFAFSIIPIQISRWIGVVLTFLGFIFLIYTIIMYFFDPTVPLGWSSLMSVMLIFGGIIILAIGIMGEFIGRIYMLGNKNPQFVVREVITKNKEITISQEDGE
jgi:undecaprenyl-phosphate 4-deoxy-4-formamido-L-arabinose transferase